MRERPLRKFTVYCLDRNRGVVKAEDIMAPTPEDAAAVARSRKTECEWIELWEGPLKVLREPYEDAER